MPQIPFVTMIVIFFLISILASAVKILREYERGVIFRLGRLIGGDGVKGPGLILLIPVIDKMVKVSLLMPAILWPDQSGNLIPALSPPVDFPPLFMTWVPNGGLLQVCLLYLRPG